MRGIVFDIDDTLYCRQDMLVQSAETVLGIKVKDRSEFISIFYKMSDINMADLESGKISTHDINGWRYNETFRILGLPFEPEDGGKAADAYLDLQSHMRLSKDMISVLDALKTVPQIKLAILTAGESKHQWHKVDMLGLDRWFERENIIVTGDTPYTKPDKELFRMIEEKLGISPSVLWMIGDNYDKDIAGAINCGWHTVWLNRRGLPVPSKAADIVVATEDELTSYLNSFC